MVSGDEELYRSLVNILNEKTHTPLFLSIAEDFVHAIFLNSPGYKERFLNIRPSSESPILKPFAWYKARILLPALDGVWNTAMENRLGRPEYITTIPIFYGRAKINGDLSRLFPDVDLNDVIIDCYLDLVRNDVEDAKQYCIATTRLLSLGFCYGPIDSAIHAGMVYEDKRIIVPVFQDCHWTFAVLEYEVDAISVQFYDSFSSEASFLPTRLQHWIESKFPGISYSVGPLRGPQQRTMHDCGVIMLMGIRLIAAGLPHLSQDEADEVIPLCRQRILAELLAFHLNPRPEEYHLLVEKEQLQVGSGSPGASSQLISGGAGVGVGDGEDPIVFEDSPIDESHNELDAFPTELSASLTESPLGAVGNGEAFMGAALANDVEPCISQAQDSPGLFWTNQFPEFRDLDELPAIAREESVVESAEVLTRPPSPDSGAVKGKSLEPAVGIGEVSCTDVALPVQIMPTVKKPATENRALSYAFAFAEERTIVNALRSAAQARRVINNTVTFSQQTYLATLWSSVEAEDSKPRILQSRHNRQQFSQQFLARQAVLHRQGKKSQASSILKKEIGIESYGSLGKKTWRAANLQVTRASIWTELSEIFLEALGQNRFVALCAAPETTTTMEGMNLPQRQLFLDRIRRRLADPKDEMMSRLKAAGPLYSALMNDNLLLDPLYIETWRYHWPLHSSESFEEIVSLRTAPSQHALPARSRK